MLQNHHTAQSVEIHVTDVSFVHPEYDGTNARLARAHDSTTARGNDEEVMSNEL